ncbi:MAG: ethanolamine utilization microcompartment protein EutL [Deltaproteobacteria bacterium]|nr:ethanolamine utilization microcompartment protein EutL [Deltaproteobacteria bacterium]
MILEPIKPRVLAVRAIPQVDAQLAARLKLEPRHRSVGMITCTIDDALYAALDAGTKAAAVDVVYAKSFYAGAAHASGPFSGEIIGIYAAEDEEIVSSGLQAALRYLADEAWFFAADEAGALGFFPHVIPSVGRYLAAQAQVAPGTPMAYLIAPPLEAVLALDQALKAADVELKVFYAPPSETNFAGGLLTGDQPAVEAAAAAFRDTVLDLAANPRRIDPAPSLLLEGLQPRTRAVLASRYRLHGSGMELAEKPSGFTHLFDDHSLVPKHHPVIRLRGAMDLLQAQVIDAAVAAAAEGHGDVRDELREILAWLRALMAAEVVGRPVPELTIAGFTGDELHHLSHDTTRYLGVGWVLPDPSHGLAVAKLNLLRAQARQVELSAEEALRDADHVTPVARERILHGLNRLSNALYVLTCKLVGRVPPSS